MQNEFDGERPLPLSIRHSSFVIRHSPRRPAAFTLAELLIVIALIVLSLALAVPALNSISGNRSVESATNQVAAALGRARMEAIGLQRPTGILFTKDGSGRVTMMMVTVTGSARNPSESGDNTAPSYQLIDAVPDRDTVNLPSGVNIQTVDEAELGGQESVTENGVTTQHTVRLDDGYIGFNVMKSSGSGPTLSDENIKVGGLILFDGQGRLSSVPYALRLGEDPNGPDKPPGIQPTALGKLLKVTKANNEATSYLFFPRQLASGGRKKSLKTQIGFVLFDGVAFNNTQGVNGRDADADPQIGGDKYDEAEKKEEWWIDDNASPVLINRYSGALVRGA